MLEHTFIHIPGVGPKTERHLWENGILTWRDYLENENTPLPPARDTLVRHILQASIENSHNIHFFLEKLSPGEMWRTFDRFKDKAVYLDIETSGFFQGVDEITVIGMYDGKNTKTFVQGINLEDFESAVAPFDVVITFNGSQFDLPFIRRQFPNILLPPAHIDLRFFLKKLGYRGGLKAIEKSFDLSRASSIDGMDGYEAVLLWRAYQWGDEKALDRLIEYNTADIVNLAPLMQWGYQDMKKRLLSCSERWCREEITSQPG